MKKQTIILIVVVVFLIALLKGYDFLLSSQQTVETAAITRPPFPYQNTAVELSPATVATLLDLLRADAAMTPEGAAEIALLADALADSIEELYPESLRDLDEAQGFIFEIMAYSVYERILPETTRYDYDGEMVREPTREIMPLIELRHYWGDKTFHLMGTAPCWDASEPININVRYFNPVSPMYNKAANQIGVLIHEVMHMEGVCPETFQGDEYNVDVEAATQVATLEVLAAMTRHGNMYGLLPFLREIQGFASDVVLLWALENDDLDKYRQEILIPTANNAYRIASFEKSMEHWHESYALTFRLRALITSYGVQPYVHIVNALKNDNYETTTKLPFPNPKKTIHLNDVAYVLDNIKALVNDYHLIVWD